MKTKIGLILCALAIGPAWLVLRAEDPDKPRTRGRVLLLDHDRVIQGEIERIGAQYRIRRTAGETVVPADSVQCLCADLPEAYAYLRGHANLRDADECIRLARWCQLHGLREQALAEATTAAALRPESPECQRLVRSLQRSTAQAAHVARLEPAEPAAAPVPVSADSMGAFVTKVQPILMNTCASCHVGERGGRFHLVRAVGEGLVNRRSTQHNLSAVLGQVSAQHWETSPLLVKAISIHGELTTQPPIKGRQAQAFKTLEEWVRETLEQNPQLQASDPAIKLASHVAAEKPTTKSEPTETKPSSEQGTFASGSQGTAPAAQAAPRGPVDPFDPVIFNRANPKR
jgi:hypothetical protein